MFRGKSSESVQCAMLKACDACVDMGQLAPCTDSEDFPVSLYILALCSIVSVLSCVTAVGSVVVL